MDELQARALDIVGGCRVYTGDLRGLEDSERAIALAREKNAFSRLIVAELNSTATTSSSGSSPPPGTRFARPA
jgi:predicted TPR repeat methyltransferase